MPGHRFRSPLPLLLALALAACGDSDGDASSSPATGESEAASEVASGTADAALFDTIAWPDDRAALDRGATVYAYSCAECHGDSGRGDGGYRMQGRVLRPPSFTSEDWRFANDLAGLRAYVYEGNNKGMPHWGELGLKPRDVDAVSRYVIRRLWAGM